MWFFTLNVVVVLEHSKKANVSLSKMLCVIAHPS